MNSYNSQRYEQKDVQAWCLMLVKSYAHWMTESLLDAEHQTPEDIYEALYNAGSMIVSHKYEKDEPRFIFSNKKAEELWGYTKSEFNGMASRFTAEKINREERQKLLDEAHKNGFIENYEGIRITKSGEKIKIKDVLLFNVLNDKDEVVGQAAKFKTYEYI